MKLDGTSIDEPSHRKSEETDGKSTGEPPNKKRKRNESFKSPATPASEDNFQKIPEESEGTSIGEPPNIKRKRNKSYESPHTPASVVQFQEISEESVKRTISMEDKNSTDESPTNKQERIAQNENAHIPASVLHAQDKSQESDGVWKTLSENVENLANTCKRAEKRIKEIPSTFTKSLCQSILTVMAIFTNILQDVPSTLVEKLCDSMETIIAFLRNILQGCAQIPEWISDTIKRAANTTLSDKLLDKLAGMIGKNWESLGLELGLSSVEIDHISLDNKTTARAIFAMLRKWQTSKPEDAKASDLLMAICNCKVVNVDWTKVATLFL